METSFPFISVVVLNDSDSILRSAQTRPRNLLIPAAARGDVHDFHGKGSTSTYVLLHRRAVFPTDLHYTIGATLHPDDPDRIGLLLINDHLLIQNLQK